MGYLKFPQGEMAEAHRWYEKAVKLDSQSYLAHYYYAAFAMSRGRQEQVDDAQIESSLRTVIKLNPQFAPAYDQLAMYFGMRQKNLEEAHMLSLHAISLDPSNLAYWMNTANPAKICWLSLNTSGCAIGITFGQLSSRVTVHIAAYSGTDSESLADPGRRFARPQPYEPPDRECVADIPFAINYRFLALNA